jgi:hypothetical protein
MNKNFSNFIDDTKSNGTSFITTTTTTTTASPIDDDDDDDDNMSTEHRQDEINDGKYI